MSHNRKEGNSSVLRKTLLNTAPHTPYNTRTPWMQAKTSCCPRDRILCYRLISTGTPHPYRSSSGSKTGWQSIPRSASGHTHTISNASGSHSGDYYYKIWNADLPGLTLTSRVQEVLVYSGQPVRVCLEYATGGRLPYGNRCLCLRAGLL